MAFRFFFINLRHNSYIDNMNDWTHNKFYSLLILLLMSICTITASADETNEEHLKRVVAIYYDGTNEYEFYQAINNYLEYAKEKSDYYTYYHLRQKEIIYDINHNEYSKALEKTIQLKNDLLNANAETYYYMIDYLMGLFYGTRENNKLSKEHFIKAADKAKVLNDKADLLLIYQTMANICIFNSLEESLQGYKWADLAYELSEDPIDRHSSMSLKSMVAFGHNDKDMFDKCWRELEKIKKANPDVNFWMYSRYVLLGRYAFDGDYDQAVSMCDSITEKVGRLYFLTQIYKLKGDLKAENAALVSLLKAKDERNDDISTLTVNDINQNFLLKMKQLEAQEREQYVQVSIIVGIVIALTLAVIFFFRKKES